MTAKKQVIRVLSLVLVFGALLTACGETAPGKGTDATTSSATTKPTTALAGTEASGAKAVFDELFTQPDWESLVRAAEITATPFEGAADYAAVLESMTAGKTLTYAKVGNTYQVFCENQVIGSFSLVKSNGTWTLDELSLVISRDVSCTMIAAPDSRVTVNGVALDDSYIIQTVSTVAEDYIPADLNGYQVVVYRVDGLAALPTVDMTANGAAVQTVFDAESCTFTQVMPDFEVSEAEKQDLLTAAKMFCKYMIGNVSKATVQKYVDPNSGIFKTMTSIATWMQSYKSHYFAEAEIADYYRYSDDLYSARVKQYLMVVRKDGTVKEYPFHSTLLMQRQGDKWMVVDIVNQNLQDQVSQVRLDFMHQGALIQSQMVSSNAIRVALPHTDNAMHWYDQAAGDLIFVPNEDGTANVPYGFTLTPMVLVSGDDSGASLPDEWESSTDGIRIEHISGHTYNAHVMIIRDPSQVYMATSTEKFSKDIPGLRMEEAIEKEGAIAAINAGAFYDNGTSDLIVGSMPEGLVIAGGKVVWNKIQMGMPENGFVGFNQDNELVVATSMTASKATELGIRDGCCFGPALIMDGKVNEKVYNGAIHYNPRTAIGQRADGAVIFLCIEGRIANSLGASYRDIIDIMLRFGAVNACNLDGGSSAVMFYRDPITGQADWVNTYSVLQPMSRRMPNFFMVRPSKEN